MEQPGEDLKGTRGRNKVKERGYFGTTGQDLVAMYTHVRLMICRRVQLTTMPQRSLDSNFATARSMAFSMLLPSLWHSREFRSIDRPSSYSKREELGVP